MALSSVIYGLSTTAMTPDERSFFRDADPYGYILFTRNCESPDQVRALTAELKSLSGRERLPILIDQEGGRVARLKAPNWPLFPPARTFAVMKNREAAARAAYLNARLIAHELVQLGITVDCAPVADVPAEGAHDVIGDRAFGEDPEQVIALAGAQAKGLMEGGVVPVMKHIPGHGRARCDSHHELPTVEAPLDALRQADFKPFAALKNLPMAMTAHVCYTAVDEKRMATLSPAVVKLIREEIGFKGLLMTDDLSMKAMEGGFAARAQAALAAGCDVVLHCNGDMAEMREVAAGVSALAGESLRRAAQAMDSVKTAPEFDGARVRHEMERLIAEA